MTLCTGYMEQTKIFSVKGLKSKVQFNQKSLEIQPLLWGKAGGGVLRKYLYGVAQSRFQNVDHLYSCVLKKKKKKKKNTRSLYLTCMTKPTHLYTIFTAMMTHYYHFHQQNSPSSYHHRNKGSFYLEQFQNHPIGVPKLMKMHLKIFEHSRTPCFREYPPGGKGRHTIYVE